MPLNLQYGRNSPFSGEERETINAIVEALQRRSDPASLKALRTVQAQFSRLEAFGDLLAHYPSPLARQRLGHREYSFESLIDRLCCSTPANFEFHEPTRAIVGRALDMAESNFYRLLRQVCRTTLEGSESEELREQAEHRMREVIYTKLVEEVLADIVTDDSVSMPLRRRAVRAIVSIWDRRLTYRTSEFFPLLDAAWEARNRLQVVGGTLMGTHEVFSLLREGCDPAFVDYLVRDDPTEEETEAFREFLFGATAEQLASWADHRQPSTVAGQPPGLRFSLLRPDPQEPGARLYEFFRFRFLKSVARRLANLPGPKRTAEGYVMLAFLARTDENVLYSTP